MEVNETIKTFEPYSLWLVIIGFGFLAATFLPRLLSRHPLSMPILLLILGYIVVALPLGLEMPHPMLKGAIVERLTELGVIVALLGAGLKIDRQPNLKTWNATWRLLGITMVLTILLSVFIGWWVMAFAPATAMLLGAIIAPTDPVLASEVQVGAPGRGAGDQKEDESVPGKHKEDELRFSLTSEAGLNDGLAFPFTNMAIAMAIAGAHPSNWIETWLLVHVLYELAIGVIIGVGLGWLLAKALFAIPAKTDLAHAMMGLGALASTLLIYGFTELLGGYGFIATFLGAVIIRNIERDHEYHKPMHIFSEKIESVIMAVIIIGLGAAIANGLLAPLNWPIVLSAILIVFIVRPVAGIVGMIGFKRAKWRERLAISFFGIRGIGSLYYLSYALNKATFPGAEEIWALVGLIVAISIFVHGITATPIIIHLDKARKKEA